MVGIGLEVMILGLHYIAIVGVCLDKDGEATRESEGIERRWETSGGSSPLLNTPRVALTPMPENSGRLPVSPWRRIKKSVRSSIPIKNSSRPTQRWNK